MLIRPASPVELTAIDLLQKANSRDVGFLPSAAFAKRIAQAWLYVADDAGTVVGYLLGSKRDLSGAIHAKVYQVVVAPGHRGHDIGGQLLRTFADAAPAADTVSCWVGTDMAATRFWRKQGFEAVAARLGSERGHAVHALFQYSRHGRIDPTIIPLVCRGGPFSHRGSRAVIRLGAGDDVAGLRPDDARFALAQASLPAAAPKRLRSVGKPVPMPHWFAPPVNSFTIVHGGKVNLRFYGSSSAAAGR